MIVRVKKTTHFTIISNALLENERLSWKAKGLAAYLLSKPDDWRINRDHLAEQGPDGVAAIRTALAELISENYLVRRRFHDSESGLFVWDSTLFETPQEPEPEPELDSDEPSIGRKSTDGSSIGGKSTVIVKTDSPRTDKISDQGSIKIQDPEEATEPEVNNFEERRPGPRQYQGRTYGPPGRAKPLDFGQQRPDYMLRSASEMEEYQRWNNIVPEDKRLQAIQQIKRLTGNIGPDADSDKTMKIFHRLVVWAAEQKMTNQDFGKCLDLAIETYQQSFNGAPFHPSMVSRYVAAAWAGEKKNGR